MKRSSLIPLVLLLAAAAAQAGDPQATLPPGVVARVHGKDIRDADFLDRIAERYGSAERGKSALQKLVDDTCVDMEAKRRGTTVTDEEVRAYVAQVDKTIRQQTGGARTIEDVYKDSHSNAEEFALEARQYLIQRKMALSDLGAKPDEELTEARRMLWLSSLRRRMNVKLSGLPDGVLAQVGDVAVDRRRFAVAVKSQLSEEELLNVRRQLVLEAATEHALAEAKVVVTDADVDAEITKRRDRFQQDPRVRGTGLTFDEFLRQKFGTSEAGLRTDRGFRASIGLERLLLRRISEAAVRKRWEDNRDAYGERALVREIYVAAGDEGAKFQQRSFADAKEMALRAKVAVLEASGGLPGASAAGKKSLPDAVTAVAKQFESDADRQKNAGEPSARTRLSVSTSDEIARMIFEGETGVLLGPVKSPVGYHLFLVEERRPAPSYDDVKDRVREDLLRAEIGMFNISAQNDPGVIVPEMK